MVTGMICRLARVQYAFRVLRFEPDSSLADWFARRDEPWGERVTMGPAGFESYARACYLEEDRISQHVLFARLRVHLAGRTKTPGDCFHGLWAGAVSRMHGDPARGISPRFPASVLTDPKVRVPNRGYMVFRGHLDEVGHWGATDPTTGSSKDEELPAPHLLWPADHRWFVATDVDSDFTWVGGSRGAHRRGHHSSTPGAFTATERPTESRRRVDGAPQVPVNRSTCLHCSRQKRMSKDCAAPHSAGKLPVLRQLPDPFGKRANILKKPDRMYGIGFSVEQAASVRKIVAQVYQASFPLLELLT